MLAKFCSSTSSPFTVLRCNQFKPLTSLPKRFVHPMWQPKYRTVWKAQYYDDVVRRWDTRQAVTKRNYKTHDPLHFDHDMEYLNGGVDLIIEALHDRANYGMPIKNIAHLLYNMSIKEVYDPLVYEKFENHLRVADRTNVTARHAYGALVAYFRSNQGTQFGIDYWQSVLEDEIETSHAQEVWELCVAFRDCRLLHRQWMRDFIDNSLKSEVLIKKWKAEVVYNQRVLFGLCKEFDNLNYYDEELWTMIVDTALHKKRINNLHYFDTFYRTVKSFDTVEDHPLKGKFTTKLEQFVQKFYTDDRKWRYSLEDGGHWYTLKQMQEKADVDFDDSEHMISKAPVDERIIEQAKEAEKRLKRLKMAKYSHDLFDEIISEMMRDSRTLMEMMAELDVVEEAIYASQTRIAKKKQAVNSKK